MVAESKQPATQKPEETKRMPEQNAAEAKTPQETATSDKASKPKFSGKLSGLKFHFGRTDRGGQKERARPKVRLGLKDAGNSKPKQGLLKPMRRTFEIPIETSGIRLIAALILMIGLGAAMSVFGHFEQTQIRMRYWGIVVVSIGLTALFTAFKLNFEDRAAKTWRIIVMLLVLLMTQGMVQLACGMPEFTGSRMDPMGFGNLFLAFFIILMIFFIFYAITGRLRISVKVGAIILLILGITNHFLLLFRGDPFYFGDLISAGTGLEVVKGYTLSISGDIIAGIYLFITVFVMSFHLPKKLTPVKRKNLVMRLSAVGLAAVFALLFAHVPVEDIYDSWAPKNNQYVTAFAVNAKLLHVTKPDGYSVASVKKIVNSGAKKAENEVGANTQAGKNAVTTATGSSTKKPTIIAVMNESFSDLSVLGNMQTDKSYISFFNSLKENTVRGKLYVDVYGAGTCNTEFSFLTGNSTAFVPQNSRPYQMYVTNTTPSLAKNLKAQGYETYAMHPGQSTAWKRNKVYPYLGFDHTYFYEDSFRNAELTRNYTSDRATYQKIINLYKNRGSKPQFIFDVTIANHGGYSVGTAGMDQVHITSMPHRTSGATDYTYEEEFLTLMRESDKALKEMITYFKSQKEPVAVVFFGDHQPRLNDNFYTDMKGKSRDNWTNEETQQQYVTPYVIWTNYDIQEKSNNDLSVNYLQSTLLQTLGLKTTAYDKYQQSLKDTLPVLSIKGVKTSDGDYLTLEDGKKYNASVQNYQKVLYNNMFDRKNRVRRLFLHKNAVDGKSDDELRGYLKKYDEQYRTKDQPITNVVK